MGLNTYTLKFVSGSTPTLYDLSPNISDIKDVPYFVRNPDYTIVTDGYDFNVAITSPYISSLNINTQILFYSSSVLIHNGKIQLMEYLYDKKEYKVTVQHAMQDLNLYKYNKDNVDTYLSGNYKAYTLNGQTNYLVKHNDIITACFNTAGYSLDWSKFTTESKHVHYTYGTDISASSDLVGTASANNVWYLPEAMYCLNQAGVYSPLWLKYISGDANNGWQAANDAYSSMPSLFEMVNILSSMFGYNYIPKDSGSFYIINYTSASINMNIPDDGTISRTDTSFLSQSNGVVCSFNALTLWTNGSYADNSYNINPFEVNKNRWFPSTEPQRYYVYDSFVTQSQAGSWFWEGQTTDQAGLTVNNPYTYSTYNTQRVSNVLFGLHITQQGSLLDLGSQNIKWYDHLVPIINVGAGVPYLVIPAVQSDNNTIVDLQRTAILSSGVEKEIQCFASYSLGITKLSQAQEIRIVDPSNDISKIVWREYF